jgi:porphobilinogen synthase
MDPPNAREAVREACLDLDEGADFLIVKPALAYMDLIRAVREVSDVPVACYNVSGEYAMVKAAALNGWIDEDRIVDEMLVGFARAGADIIITYFAKSYAARRRA